MTSGNGFDLETLANMGITQDTFTRNEQKVSIWRIGRDEARANGTGGGRWVSNAERAKLPDAVKGYGMLPKRVKDGNDYSTIERFHFAAEAGTNGVPKPSGEYLTLGTTIEGKCAVIMNAKNGKNGLPDKSVLWAYWNHNIAQAEKGYSPVTPKQFAERLINDIEQLVKDAETSALKLTKTAKETVITDPKCALQVAVNADYLTATVVSLAVKALTMHSSAQQKSPSVYVAGGRGQLAAALD